MLDTKQARLAAQLRESMSANKQSADRLRRSRGQSAAPSGQGTQPSRSDHVRAAAKRGRALPGMPPGGSNWEQHDLKAFDELPPPPPESEDEPPPPPDGSPTVKPLGSPPARRLSAKLAGLAAKFESGEEPRPEVPAGS